MRRPWGGGPGDRTAGAGAPLLVRVPMLAVTTYHNALPTTSSPRTRGSRPRRLGRRVSGASANRQETDAVGDRSSRQWMAYGPTYEAGSRTGGRPIPHGSRLPRDVSEGRRPRETTK